jgi:hypothetical protein
MTTRSAQRPPEIFVFDSEALSQAVHGQRVMMGLLGRAARGEVQVVTSPMTLVEAFDGRVTERRWDWVLSRVRVADLGKEDARRARRLLHTADLHGHKHAIDAVLAVVALRQRGDVTVLTSDVDDLRRLLPPTVVVRKV